MEELNYSGEKFEYFGFRYCIANDDKSVALKQVPYAKGKIFIPKEVEYNNKKYPVIQIGGFTLSVQRMTAGVIETDRRKKDYWREKPHWVFDHEEFVSPFTENNGYASDFDRQIVPNSTIASVILPDSIRFLGNSAFRRCYALEEVNLPKGITVIPVRAFSGCIALKSIQLHEGITEIGDMAFFGCTAMKEIMIPSTVTKIGKNAFGDSEQNKSGLKVVNILNDEGAVIIHPNAFTDRVKINYLGKKEAKKAAPVEQKKDATPAKGASIDLEKLIQAALVDGVVTDKERAILVKKVKEAGGDVDEFEMLLDARIYEAQQKNGKAKSEPKPAPKPEPKPAKTASAPKVEPKPAAKPVSTNGNLTVGSVVEAFKKQFGAVLRIYNGRSKADGGMSLQEVGLKQEISTTFDGKQKVGDFIAQMAKVGLTVKVYTCDDWVAVLDGLTLEQAGKVKKSATKADMESMISKKTDADTSASQFKKSAVSGDYTIGITPDSKVVVSKGGTVCDNAKGTMREISEMVGFKFETSWTTQQFGSKLVDFLNSK